MSNQNYDFDADYVVVGAGSAGCVMAARLSEDPSTRVVLLEAGGEDRNRWIHIPLGYGKTFADASVNWCYQAEPDPGANGRSIFWPRGKVLGGSSAMNASQMGWCSLVSETQSGPPVLWNSLAPRV